MRPTERLLDQLNRAYGGEAWHGPALRNLLDGVSEAQAKARPIRDGHSILELVVHIRNLYAYNRWANHRITSACRPLDTEALTRNLGNSFGSIRDTLVHTVWAEWIWLERWQGRSPKQPAGFNDFHDIDAIEKRWRE